MATIQCKKCGRRIMAKEKVCPHCGEPVPHDMFEFTLPKFTKKDETKKNQSEDKQKDETKKTKPKDQQTEQKQESPKHNKNLIMCTACGEQISKNATVCPHCGEPVPQKKKTSIWTWLVLLLFIGYIVGQVDDRKTHNATSSSSYSKSSKPKKEDRNTLKGGYFACTTDELFDEITMASVKKDKLAIGHLLSRGCVLTKEGVRFSIIDFGFATTKIRAYDGTDSIILYTNTENIID